LDVSFITVAPAHIIDDKPIGAKQVKI